MSPALEARIRGLIAERGPLSFRDFMELALYEPEHGYYSTLRGFGAQGDFITSPETHPAFGALVGRQALDLWEALRRPTPFQVLEIGGGAGAFARSAIDWARSDAPDLFGALRYTIDERSASLRAIQQRALAGLDVRWGQEDRPHFVVANELLDAFPVHRVVIHGGELRELRVAVGPAGRLTWVESADVPEKVRAYFGRLGVLPPEGGVAEVNVGLADWVRELAARLPRGLALILDYGHLADELFTRPQGTLLTYFRHTLGSDPLVRVGRQDISTHVDFTTLATEAHHAGLDVLGLTSQRSLLTNLGIAQFAAALGEPADRHALARLVDPEGLGRIKALFLGKRLGAYVPAGLRGGRAWDPPRFRPSLPAEPPPEEFMEMWRDAFGAS